MSMDLDTEANLAAIALTRLAIEHRDYEGGSVMDTIKPYLEKYCAQPETERNEDGSANIGPAVIQLLANLSQQAGATFEAYVTAISGGVKPTKEQLFDRLASFEVSQLGGEPGAGEERG